MLSLSPATKIFLVAGATDMRKAYDTLAAIVTNALGADPLSGHLFVFANRARNRLKILVWETGGYWLLSRRLEEGTFAWPASASPALELTPTQLTLLLGGIDLRQTKERKWYRR
jgi:transposase